ncbi:hypothetical protein ACNOYE_11820 [Nannocystaceae bacterium ST9]
MQETTAPSTRETKGQHLARGLVRVAIVWLELEDEANRHEVSLAREAGAVAVLGGFGGLAARAERLLEKADPHASSMTNDEGTGTLAAVSLPHGQQLAEMFPVYDRDAVMRTARTEPRAHRELALAQRWDEAWAACKDDHEREEVVALRALLHDFDGARAMLGQPSFPDARKPGPLVIIAIESFQRGEMDRTHAVLDELERSNDVHWWVHAAAGLLGRLPWVGYPFPDF